MKTLSLFICLSLVSGFAFSQWIEQNPIPTNNFLNSVFFPDANIGYAVGQNGTILKTSNGGTSWTTLSSGTNAKLNSVFFTNNNTGYAGGDDSYGAGIILKTIDGGITWNTLSIRTTDGLYSICFANKNTGYIICGQTILKTIDGGITWISLLKNFDSWLQSSFFTDAYIGYVVGWFGTILKTSDGGNTWTTFRGTGGDLHSVYFTDSNTGYVVGGYNNQVGRGCYEQIIMKTIDGGKTWLSLIKNEGSPFTSVFFTDDKTGYVVGNGEWDESGNGYKHIILKTIDGGTTWKTLSHQSPGGLNSVFFANDSTGYAVGEHGTILKTTNGGGWNSARKTQAPASTFSVYPNPSKDFVTFDLPYNSKSATVELYDIQGKKVIQQKLTETKQIAVGHLPKGLYLYRLTDGEKVYSGKLVVE